MNLMLTIFSSTKSSSISNIFYNLALCACFASLSAEAADINNILTSSPSTDDVELYYTSVFDVFDEPIWISSVDSDEAYRFWIKSIEGRYTLVRLQTSDRGLVGYQKSIDMDSLMELGKCIIYLDKHSAESCANNLLVMSKDIYLDEAGEAKFNSIIDSVFADGVRIYDYDLNPDGILWDVEVYRKGKTQRLMFHSYAVEQMGLEKLVKLITSYIH